MFPACCVGVGEVFVEGGVVKGGGGEEAVEVQAGGREV